MGPILKLILPKVLGMVMKEVAKLVKPLQKYVHEDNELDLAVTKINKEIKTLKELLLDTQSDVVKLQKAQARKARKRGKK